MAKIREKAPLVESKTNSEIRDSDPEYTNGESHPWVVLLGDIFYRPHSAFDSFQNTEVMGGKDLFRLHILLSFLAPLSKFLHNLIKATYQYFWNRTPITGSDLTSGLLGLWVFYVGLVLFVRFADVFRMYYKVWDRRTHWEPFPPWVLMVAFLPLTSSGVFFLLPVPLNILLFCVAGIYSLQLAFQALQNLDNWTGKDFVAYLLQVGIFLTFVSAIVFGLFNLYRTIVT